MKVLDNPTQLEWKEILHKPDAGLTRILCVVDDFTPASIAVEEIIKVFEKNNRHETIIISNDSLLVKLLKLQFESQLRANKRFKPGSVVADMKVLLMNISADAVSFANAFEPDVVVINEKSLKHFQSFKSKEQVIIRNIKSK